MAVHPAAIDCDYAGIDQQGGVFLPVPGDILRDVHLLLLHRGGYPAGGYICVRHAGGEDRAERLHDYLPGAAGVSGGHRHQVRRLGCLRAVGGEADQEQEKRQAGHGRAGAYDFRGRRVQLPDGGDRDAAHHGQMPDFQGEAGLSAGCHSRAGVYHRADLQLGGGSGLGGGGGRRPERLCADDSL